MAEEINTAARRSSRSLSISTIVSITLVLLMLGMLGILLLHAQKISNYVKENVELTIFLKNEATQEEISALMNKITSDQIVKSAQFVDRDTAAARLKTELGEDFVKFLGYNPLLPSIDVHLKADYAEMMRIEHFQNQLNFEKPVKEVVYQQTLVEGINRNLRIITFVILGFSALLFIISLALINNTIRLSLYAKRMLIKSMQLVGATESFICRPFLLKGIRNGFFGALLANLLIIGLLYFANKEVPELLAFGDLKILLSIMGLLIIGGIIISLSSTFIAVYRYLHKSADELI